MSFTRFGDALILAVSSCPKWPRHRDLKNVPGQAKDLKNVFQDLGFCTWHPDQEKLTQQGVKDVVADLCKRTERKLQEMPEEHYLVTVAVLSHGRLRAGSELPDMVCYDSLGEHIDSNDADLDEVLIEGFRSIQVPEGKRLKVWLLLDCCQSNEEMSRWRAPERMTRPERRCFGHPSHVDFLFVFSCDPGREAHDYFSMSKAIIQVLTCRVQPITLYDACDSAMDQVEKWSSCTIRPRIVVRGGFRSIRLLEKLPGQGHLSRVNRFLRIHELRFLIVLIFLVLLCICCYGFYQSLRLHAILHASVTALRDLFITTMLASMLRLVSCYALVGSGSRCDFWSHVCQCDTMLPQSLLSNIVNKLSRRILRSFTMELKAKSSRKLQKDVLRTV